jgi:ribosomal protein S18 acetylase RimI-like enzyme
MPPPPPPPPSSPSPTPTLAALSFRPLAPHDLDQLRALHAALFPIDYDEDFFVKASTGADRIYSYAAFEDAADEREEQEEGGGDDDDDGRAGRRRPSDDDDGDDDDDDDDGGRPVTSTRKKQRLVGVVTARLVRLHECEPPDRRALGLASPAFDGELASYVLTLGVSASGPWRRRGVARALVRMCCAHAASARCRAAFLHVAAYNEGALALYGSLGFEPLARHAGFYTIATGRQPDRDVTSYDAVLHALPLAGSRAQQRRGGAEEGAARALARLVLQDGCRVSGAAPPSPFAPGWGGVEAAAGAGGGRGLEPWWWPASWLGGAVGRRPPPTPLATEMAPFPSPVPPPPPREMSVATTSARRQQGGGEDDGGEEVSSAAVAAAAALVAPPFATPPVPPTPPSRARAGAPSPPETDARCRSNRGGGGVLRWLFGARSPPR